jgi:nucleotide-binding universal stress UspA family protein
MSADVGQPARREDGIPVRRILIATDFSEASRGALAVGSELGRLFGAELLLVHVLPDVDPARPVEDALGMEPGDLLERLAGEAEGRLRRIEAAVGRGHLHASVRCGAAAAEILRLAGEAAADLIVLGWHGATIRRDSCRQPVAERVRERAACPVLIALPASPHGPETEGARPAAIHGLLVATDLTARSEAAVRWGRALGRTLGCPVHVLHVVGPGRRRRRARAGVSQPDTVRAGDPAAQIVSCARELGDDLIVLGSGRRGSLRRAVLGSVGRAVVERAAAPTLTVR